MMELELNQKKPANAEDKNSNINNHKSNTIVRENNCSDCVTDGSVEYLFHSHVSQFDQLLSLTAIVGEYFKTHNNVTIVVSGSPVEYVRDIVIKADPICPDDISVKQECNDSCNNADDIIDNSVLLAHTKALTLPKKAKEETQKVNFCDECGKTFKERSSLWRHRKVVHEKVKKYVDRSKILRDYSCPICGELIHDTYQRYFVHKQLCEAKATGINPYVCSICGRSFPTTNHHANHYTACSGKAKKYYNNKICTYEDCTYKTSNKIELDNHIRRTHLNIPISKNHVCTLCGNAYNKMSILNQHIKAVHMHEKPHECPTCGRSFARKQKMKDHMKIHTGESKYTCPLCNKTFGNADSRWNHKKSCAGRKDDVSIVPDSQPLGLSII